MALYSNTLQVIRHYLSSSVGDLIIGTADSGTSATIVDTMLRKADDYYNEHFYKAYIYEGTNIGEEREVSDWVNSGNTLTLAPVFTAAIDSTSKYELHRIFTEGELRKAINLAIESLAGKYLIDLKDEATTLSADTYEYDLPLTMLYIHRITTEDTVASGTYENQDVVDPRDYRIIKSYPPKLKLDDKRYSITAGKDLRLEGQGTQAIVDGDADVIYLPPGWLIQKAITFLPYNKIESNKLDNTYRQALLLSAREPRVYPNPRSQAVVE